MKELSEKELKNKAEAYCSAAEHCPSEVETKLRQWGASDDWIVCVLQDLEKDRFIDVNRFCRAFVRDKYRFAGWGRVKIVQALKMKRLPEAAIAAGLEDIDEEEYMQGLSELLNRKKRGVTGRNEYGRNMKLLRFAAGRGYTTEEVRKCLKETWENEPVE